MVRIYCLSSISKIPSNENNIETLPYKNGADELLSTGREEEKTPLNITNSKMSQYYELTEICIGYKYSNERKVYAMHIYRKDTNLYAIRMVRGAVQFEKVMDNVFDISIATSKLFPGKVNHDLQIRIRWIKNTSVKGRISKDEQAEYEKFAFKAKMNQVLCATNAFRLEGTLQKMTLKLSNESGANVLRTKLSDFTTLIDKLCHPITGSYKQVPIDKRYNQKVLCYLSQHVWIMENPRKGVLEQQAKNTLGCYSLRWSGVNLKSNKLDNFEPEKVTSINFENVRIFENDKSLHSCLKDIHFPNLKDCSMDLCHIQELNNEFFQMLPASLTQLSLKNNRITSISKDIAKLTWLTVLWLDKNENLTNEGFPWNSLPQFLVELSLGRTNIHTIPAEIRRLNKLISLNVTSKALKHVEWTHISKNIESINIEAKDELNDIDLGDKVNLKSLDVLCAGFGATKLDSYKLPPNAHSFNFQNNGLSSFYLDREFPFLYALDLENNCFTSLEWEFLPKTLVNLFFEYNSITEIGNISHLTMLKYLGGSYNQIKNISDSICKLQHLTKIYLTGNRISALPENFENLKNLETLDVSSNKFDSAKNDLDKVLWKRLPANLEYFNISNNPILKLPCHLKNYNIQDLKADNCKLIEICPNLYMSRRPGRYQHLDIENNPDFQYLPFIPLIIYQPSSTTKSTDSFDVNHFTLTSTNQGFVGTSKFSMKLGKPQYLFKEAKDLIISCKCCAYCGKQTENKLIQQLMVMDFNFKKSLFQNVPCAHNKLHSADFIQTMQCPTCPEEKYKRYSAGEWNSKIKTRLCTNCINIIKQKTDDAFEKHKTLETEDTIKKRKEAFNNASEVLTNNLQQHQNTELKHSKSKLNKQKNVNSDSTLNATYLLLKNPYAVDCFLNAAVNAIDSMEILKDLICRGKGSIVSTPQIELIKILQREILNVRELRQTLPAYASNEQEDAASALLKLIGLLDYQSKKILQFTYDTFKKCQCGETRICGAQNCDALSITVVSAKENTFNNMLDQWLSSETNICQTCKTNIKINHFVKRIDQQKYLIVDVNSWVNENGSIVQRRILSKDFNPDTQFIFGVPWMLICAVEYKGDSKQGHYLTWRRYIDKWIVISDDYYTFENQLLDDLSHYKILVYAKNIDNVDEGYATFYPQEHDDGINEDRMVYGEPFQDNNKISACELEINENLHPKNINCEFPILSSENCQNSFTKNENIVNYNTSNNQQYSQIIENNDIIMNENNSVCDQTPIVYETAAVVHNRNTENENSSAMQMDCVENNAIKMILSTFSDYYNDSDVNMLPLDSLNLSYQNSQLPMTNYSAEKVTEFTAVPFGDNNISEPNFTENFFHAMENTASALPSTFSHYHTTLDTHNCYYNAHHYNLPHQNNGETYVEQNCYYHQPYQHNIGQTLHHQTNVDVQMTELPLPTQVSETGYQDYQPPATFQSKNTDNMTIENNNRQNNFEDVIDWGNLLSEW